MRLFVVNLLLALLWVALGARFTLPNLIVGFLLGYLVTYLGERGSSEGRYFKRVPLAIGVALFFLGELVRSSLRIAWDVLTPTHRMRPAVIGVPLEAKTDAEITLLAQLISLTPGSLSLDVSSDRKTLYVHVMYVDDVNETRRRIKEGFETRVLRLLR
jgi:multicomponent Na+:H+ antiporter subunit E